MGSYMQYALIALGLVLVLGLLYWRWRKVSTANKSLETELKVLQPYHNGPESLPRPSAPAPTPAPAKPTFVPSMPTFIVSDFEPKFVTPPSKPVAPTGSIVELVEEPAPTLPTFSSLADVKEEEDDEGEDDDVDDDDVPPPLITLDEGKPADVPLPAAEAQETAAEPVAGAETVSEEPTPSPTPARGRPGRKPKAKTT